MSSIRSRFYLFVFLAFSLLCVQSAHSQTDVSFQLPYQGRARVFTLHLPSSSSRNTPLPLLIVLHGGGGSIENVREMTNLSATADARGFAVLYPEGSGLTSLKTWNAGDCCGSAQAQNVDDVGFIKATIQFVERRFAIDSKRIYATGFSNGAEMAYKLACDLSEMIAGIAPVAAPPLAGDLANCHPTRRVPVIHFHGKQDQCASFNGGQCLGCFQEFASAIGLNPRDNDVKICESVPSYIDTWRQMNGCSTVSTVVAEYGSARCEKFVGCSSSADVQFCTDDNLGHDWPSGGPPIAACATNPNGYLCSLWSSIVGPASDTLDANNIMWDFLSQYTLDRAPTVQRVEVPIALTSLELKPGRSLKVSGRGRIPPLSGNDSPAAQGAELTVSGNSGTVNYSLPQDGWKAVGRRQGAQSVKYKGSLCKSVQLSPGSFQATCDLANGTFRLPETGPVSVVLEVGNGLTVCGVCGGKPSGNQSKKYKHTKCSVPEHCE